MKPCSFLAIDWTDATGSIEVPSETPDRGAQ